MQLQQSEWHAWYMEPATQAFVQMLKDKVDETKDRWANQAFVNPDDAVASERANFYALAGIDVLGQVIEMVEDMRPILEGESE
jgi:hypothetical protein